MSNRYHDYPDPNRPDLVICHDCTSRNYAVAIPRDEIPQHDDWHATDSLTIALSNVFRGWV